MRQPPDLEQVFSRHIDPVYRFLYSRVGNHEDAEDLTSEVFLKATRRLEGGRAEASVTVWLFTVARTVLADHWRRYYRAGTPVPIDEAHLAEAPEELGQSDKSQQSARRVAELLDRLPDRYRRVIELRFLYGYSIQDTAQEMAPEFGERLHARVFSHQRRITRRAAFLLGLAALAAGVIAGVGLGRITEPAASSKQPPLEGANGRWYTVATLAGLPEGAIRPFTAGAVQGLLSRFPCQCSRFSVFVPSSTK